MIKLIAIDLDGTLLTSQKEISQRNREAIQRARALGVHVVLCTGRPIKAIEAILKDLSLVGDNEYAITFNGGLVQITSSQQVLMSEGYSRDDVAYILESCLQSGLPINPIDTEYVYDLGYPKDNESQYPNLMSTLEVVKKNITEFDETHVFNKVVVCCDKDILDDRMQSLPKDFYTRFNVMKSRPILMEILPKGVDKAYGLRALCRHLDIKASEVMALGDEENDLAMITFAGYGVAMGNAIEKLKSVAYAVTDTHDNDGVAKAIERYLLTETQ